MRSGRRHDRVAHACLASFRSVKHPCSQWPHVGCAGMDDDAPGGETLSVSTASPPRGGTAARITTTLPTPSTSFAPFAPSASATFACALAKPLVIRRECGDLSGSWLDVCAAGGLSDSGRTALKGNARCPVACVDGGTRGSHLRTHSLRRVVHLSQRCASKNRGRPDYCRRAQRRHSTWRQPLVLLYAPLLAVAKLAAPLRLQVLERSRRFGRYAGGRPMPCRRGDGQHAQRIARRAAPSQRPGARGQVATTTHRKRKLHSEQQYSRHEVDV